MPKLNLLSLLELLPQVGPVVAKLPVFVELFEQGVAALHPKDQATAKAALKDIQADNDEGHVRLQSKLAEASAKR